MRNYLDSNYQPTEEDVLVGCISTSLQGHKIAFSNSFQMDVTGPAFDFSEKIPSESLAHICQYLPMKDINSLSLVNKTLHDSNFSS